MGQVPCFQEGGNCGENELWDALAGDISSQDSLMTRTDSGVTDW